MPAKREGVRLLGRQAHDALVAIVIIKLNRLRLRLRRCLLVAVLAVTRDLQLIREAQASNVLR